LRPRRPSAAKPITSQAAKFVAQEVRLSIRIDKATLRNIRRSAVMDDKTIKRFVLEALRAQGVEIAEQDLHDTRDS
jgi:uncharacterized protein (DUF1778 family)